MCTILLSRMFSTKCRLLCVLNDFDHVCSTKCRLLCVPYC
ncbi:hypothetical protein F383_25638 [Gossypium arboreum]|uniref:Uncharacterized protein n=1 Tax=Gossypium arboreum TaxID=29729 RepID=A0A0B0P4L3_GOSAR|nr:hypothetical protein F383_25638 [Gossypium arboreum]